jgi:hypothetical protein
MDKKPHLAGRLAIYSCTVHTFIPWCLSLPRFVSLGLLYKRRYLKEFFCQKRGSQEWHRSKSLTLYTIAKRLLDQFTRSLLFKSQKFGFSLYGRKRGNCQRVSAQELQGAKQRLSNGRPKRRRAK